jgi:hypothetical protein
MGNTIWVEVHGRPLNETADDGSTMHRLMDNLDALAAKLHVRKLSDFYDYSELEETYRDLGDESDEEAEGSEDGGYANEPSLEERQAQGKWFDSEVGFQSLRTLRQHLSQRFDDLGFIADRSTEHWPKQLMDELVHS